MVFHLTKQEKQVLLLSVAVFTVGSMVHYALGRSATVQEAVFFVDSQDAYPKLNVNTASREELVRVPYIGEYTADQIINYRPFSSLEEIKLLKGIKEKNFEKFSGFLKITPTHGRTKN